MTSRVQVDPSRRDFRLREMSHLSPTFQFGCSAVSAANAGRASSKIAPALIMDAAIVRTANGLHDCLPKDCQSSGGRREFVPLLARAAIAAGVADVWQSYARSENRPKGRLSRARNPATACRREKPTEHG
jgi:hypothetical protein